MNSPFFNSGLACCSRCGHFVPDTVVVLRYGVAHWSLRPVAFSQEHAMSNSTSNSSPDPAARSSGVASGKKTGLHQPSNDNAIRDRLENVDLASRGAKVHDHLRDKRGNGVPVMTQ